MAPLSPVMGGSMGQVWQAVAQFIFNGFSVFVRLNSQSNQSAGPVRFLIFCSISIFQLASLVAGREQQGTAGAD